MERWTDFEYAERKEAAFQAENRKGCPGGELGLSEEVCLTRESRVARNITRKVI